MPLMFRQGKLLVNNGKLALHERCCCGDWQCHACGNCCFSDRSVVRLQLPALGPGSGWVDYDCNPAPAIPLIPDLPALDVILAWGGVVNDAYWVYEDSAFDPQALNPLPGLWKAQAWRHCETETWSWAVHWWDPEAGTVILEPFIGNGGIYQPCGHSPMPAGDCLGVSGTMGVGLHNLPWQDGWYRTDLAVTLEVLNNDCCRDPQGPCRNGTGDGEGLCQESGA